MIKTRYETIETGEDLQNGIFSPVISEQMMPAVAHICLMKMQKSSSPEEMRSLPYLSDADVMGRFYKTGIGFKDKRLIKKLF